MTVIRADLHPRGTVLAGLRGSGKSNFARWLCQMEPDAVLVYDPLDQYPEYDRIRPKQRDFPKAAEELGRILNRMELWDAARHPYRLLVVDEAQRVAPGGGRPLHPTLGRLNAEHRHIPLGVVWIARRPRELHPEVVNLADHLCLWRLPGATDARFLDDTARGLADAVASLGPWEFVYVDQGRRYYRCEPAPEMRLPEGG